MVIVYIIISIILLIYVWLWISLGVYYFYKRRYIPLYNGDVTKTDYFVNSLPISIFFRLGNLLNGQNILTPDLLRNHFSISESNMIISYYISFLTFKN